MVGQLIARQVKSRQGHKEETGKETLCSSAACKLQHYFALGIRKTVGNGEDVVKMLVIVRLMVVVMMMVLMMVTTMIVAMMVLLIKRLTE